MAPSTDISDVLLISFEKSKASKSKMRTLDKGILKCSGGERIEIFKLCDIQHKYKDVPCFTEKLYLMLDDIRFVLIVTCEKLEEVRNSSDLGSLFANLCSESKENVCETFIDFINFETKCHKCESKIILLSLSKAIQVPELFGNVHNHIENLLTIDKDEKIITNIDAVQNLVSAVIGCKGEKRLTFPSNYQNKQL